MLKCFLTAIHLIYEKTEFILSVCKSDFLNMRNLNSFKQKQLWNVHEVEGR